MLQKYLNTICKQHTHNTADLGWKCALVNGQQLFICSRWETILLL